MNPNQMNPNHAYAISASATAMSWVSHMDIFLHIFASVIVIVSGALAMTSYIHNRKPNSIS